MNEWKHMNREQRAAYRYVDKFMDKYPNGAVVVAQAPDSDFTDDIYGHDVVCCGAPTRQVAMCLRHIGQLLHTYQFDNDALALIGDCLRMLEKLAGEAA